MNIRLLAAALAATCAVSGQASALVYTVTYKGIVSSGYDQSGIFGTAGADLAGKSFREDFTVDTGTPGASTEDATYLKRVSGYGASSPVSGSVTVGGVNYGFAGPFDGSSSAWVRDDSLVGGGPYASYLQSYDSQAYESVAGGTRNYRLSTYGEINSLDPGSHPNLNLNALPDYGALINPVFNASFFVSDCIYAPHNDAPSSCSQNANAYLSNFTVTSNLGGPIGDTSPGPEPTSWALMILGFGGVGAVLRDRRRMVAAV